MNTKIVPFREASAALFAVLMSSNANPIERGDLGLWMGLLFAGDRGSCCDEAAVVKIDDKLAAIASISPNGEADSGEPTIVGLYTLPQFRRRGYGKAALEVAVRRMLERGFEKIRIDALTTGALKTAESLPAEIRAVLDVHDQTGFCGLLPQ